MNQNNIIERLILIQPECSTRVRGILKMTDNILKKSASNPQGAKRPVTKKLLSDF